MQNTENTEHKGLKNYKYIDNYSDIKAVMAENLGGEKLSLGALDRIKTPTGGALNWEMMTLEGAASLPELRGVIVHEQKTRTYWETSFEESDGGIEPDCSSEDLINGRGNPGGECADCPLANFGADGARPACREGRILFLLTKNAALPVAVQLAPSGLRAFRDYKLRLANNFLLLSEVETVISLEKAASKQGIPYSRPLFRMAARATAAQKKLLTEQARAIKELTAPRYGVSARQALAAQALIVDPPAEHPAQTLPERQPTGQPIERRANQRVAVQPGQTLPQRALADSAVGQTLPQRALADSAMATPLESETGI